MENLFAYDGKVSSFIRKCTRLLVINTYWLICCIPIVTIGAATTAMYYTIQKTVMHERGYVSKEFFRSFKDNCKQGIGIWLIYVAAGAWFAECVYYFHNRMLEGNSIGFLWYLFAGVLIFLVLLVIYTFAYMARFEQNVVGTIKDSFIIMLVHFRTNIVVALILLITVLVIYLENLFLLILPVMAMFVICRSMEKIFQKYMSEEDRKLEDIENLEAENG